MNNDNPSNSSRRKFLVSGLLTISSLGVLRGNSKTETSFGPEKNDFVETVKMLTADGKLVEVPSDVAKRVSTNKPSSISELRTWVNVDPVNTESNKSIDHEG